MISWDMWETTFPRNSQAGLGRDFTLYGDLLLLSIIFGSIRPGYFSETLFPTWLMRMRLSKSQDATQDLRSPVHLLSHAGHMGTCARWTDHSVNCSARLHWDWSLSTPTASRPMSFATASVVPDPTNTSYTLVIPQLFTYSTANRTAAMPNPLE